MFTLGQIICHVVGDFALQSHGMAKEKGKRFNIALYHALFYSLPFFVFLSPSIIAMFLIVTTHAIIDRYRIPKFFNVFKNYVAFLHWGCPNPPIPPDELTGYPPDVDKHTAFLLYIIMDALVHIVVNALILRYY